MYTSFQANHFILKKQVLALTGVFRLYDDAGNVIAYSKQKMFKLREDIRVYSDESKMNEVLMIKARQIIDFSAAYDVIDSASGQKVGVLRRKGWSSLLRDEWEVLDAQDQLTGSLFEDSMALAMLRRLLLGSLLPQNYDLMMNGGRVADLRQRFNIFRYELDVDLRENAARRLDPRLAIAAAILLATIEGKQSN